MPGDVTPKLLCASYQAGTGSGQYCARSTTTGIVELMRVATASFASDGSVGSMLMVCRPCAGTDTVRVTGAAALGRNVTSTVASTSPGFAINTNVSKNGPVAP